MTSPSVPSGEALRRLTEGNRRFARREASRGSAAPHDPMLAQGQSPYAVVLGCSDSRVPPEIVFDQGPGALFVVRVAGNVATPTQVGSVEFGVEQLGARLVLVLGHSGCGAVAAALSAPDGPIGGESPNLAAVIDAVRAAVAPIDSGGRDAPTPEEAVRLNVRAAVERLEELSPLLRRLAAEGEIVVAGAVYTLDDGLVELLPG